MKNSFLLFTWTVLLLLLCTSFTEAQKGGSGSSSSSSSADKGAKTKKEKSNDKKGEKIAKGKKGSSSKSSSSDEDDDEMVTEPTEEPAEEVPDEAATEDPAEEVPDEPATEEPAEGIPDEPATEEPAEEATDEPTEEPAEEAADEPTEDPAEEATDEPVEDETGETGGGGSTLESLSFQLDWRYNAQFAGLFIGDSTGGFESAGVEMEIRQWEDGVNAVMDVANGIADFACAEQNLIIAAQAAGAPIKAVATMFQASPYGLMAPPGSDLSSLEALIGKDVGVHVDGLKVMDLVKGVNGIDDINVTEIPYTDKWERVAAGEFAGVQCYVIDEPIGVFTNYGVEPEVLKLSDFGLVSTAQTIVVSDATLAEKGDLVSAVLSAIFDGWELALSDKATAAQIVVNRYVPDGSVYKDVAYQTQTLELLEPYVRGTGGPIGVIDPTVWNQAAELMLEYGIVTELPDLATTLALEYFTP